ncbi:MAG: hypothetical protein GWM98_15740, partial [Nitrospinaceae bacterium]|nr:hypothetical protein [Nitrospinaceae bacterium]NIR55659.1 hypothetical protein [Nitrospinaceae bacterium]NIS86103.1 hypothetical protein [Nitrospinaceae bacterium]NIT82947.1 hypothetical protein [Nitrospinaceae bacterium]NIU45150.1 hypothetical protein [Nitrospinaceae bacterium]
YLLGIWGMPDPMVEAVAYHLNPSRCLDKSLSPLALLHCAHVLEPGGDEASESGAGLALD